MNITKKRLYKIKKTKNQSRKRKIKPKKKTKRKKRSFRRKRRKYNLKNKSVKKYSKKKYGGAPGDEKIVYFLMPILNGKNKLTNDWQPTHNGIGAYSQSNPTFQLAQMTLTENDNGQWQLLPQVDTGVQRPGFVPKGYRPAPATGSTFSNSLFLHDPIGNINYGGLQAPQNTIEVLFQLFNAILIRHQINNDINKTFVKRIITQLLGEGTTENPYKTKPQFIDFLIEFANNGILPEQNEGNSEGEKSESENVSENVSEDDGSNLNLPNIPSNVEENTRYDNVGPNVVPNVEPTNVETEEDSDTVNTGSVVIPSDDGGKQQEDVATDDSTTVIPPSSSDSINSDGGKEEDVATDDSTTVIPPVSSSDSINSDGGKEEEEEVSDTENKDENEPTFSVVYIKPTGGTVVLKMPTSTLYNDLIHSIRSNPDVTVEENDLLLEYVNEVSGTPNQFGDIPIEINNMDDFKRFKAINPIPTINAFSRAMRSRQYQDIIDGIPAPVEPIQEQEQVATDRDVGGNDDSNTEEEGADVGAKVDPNASGASIASGETTDTDVGPNASASSIASSGSSSVNESNKEEKSETDDDGDEDGGDDENPEEDSSELGASSSTLSSGTGSEEGVVDPTLRAHDVSYPYLIMHAQARPGPYQPELDAHIHTRGGVDADEWIQYSMLPGLTGGKKKKKRNNKGKSRKKHRRRSKSKSFKKRKKVY